MLSLSFVNLPPQFARRNRLISFFPWFLFCLVANSKVAAFQTVAPMKSVFFQARFLARFNSLSNRGKSKILFSTQQREGIQFSSNQQLAQKRLETARAKKQARQESIEATTLRHLQVKKAVQDFQVPPLYALKVSVCDELRSDLRLSGRERRGRVFIEIGSPATTNLKALKHEIHGFFRALTRSSFVLSACLPQVSPDGDIVLPENTAADSWNIETDDHVAQSFARAQEFFVKSAGATLKRPSLVLHLTKDPNAPPPPPPPAYLESMADPLDSPTMSMISFYSFPPLGIDDPEAFAESLRKKWKPFHSLGRVYVAHEGVNAQMSVPTNVLDNFVECCRTIPQLGRHMENGINVDPRPLTRDEFATAGVPVRGMPSPPFRNLHVRVRRQIVADGLDRPLDWQSAGCDLPPLEWHRQLLQAKRRRDANADDGGMAMPLILDCRNDYETNIGRFEGAEPLNTTNFRDSWEVLQRRLKDVPKDAPIMTYCTGGIRCVKVGAYLTQELGFTNVSRLAGGIIAYDRTIAQEAKDEQPLFRGANMVFDGRLGREITSDKLASCITCGGETSLITNCLNDNCHKRMVQCESCRTSFHGTCSDACKLRIVKNQQMLPRKNTDPASSETNREEPTRFRSLSDYSTGYSSPAPSLYREIEHNTKAFLPSGSHMVSGLEQGRLLTQLASMTREGRILEIGTFTGYATACFLEGAANVASALGLDAAGSRAAGPFVLTMERDRRAFDLASAHLKIMCENGVGEAGAEAACALRASDSVPEIETDLVSVGYGNAATCDLLKVSDALATLEAIALGETSGMELPAPFDLVFIDADKTRLTEYVEACLDGDRVLKKGGLIVVDNVLWKGLVLDVTGHSPVVVDNEDAEPSELLKNRRARKLASKMHHFNAAVVKDPRCEVLLLQVRDGLSLIRKK